MRFFSKPHIFYAKSNILDPQIILFDRPPSEPDQHQNYEYPETPRRKPIVSVTHAHRHLNLHLVWNAVVDIYVAYLVSVLEFKQRIGYEDRVAFFANIPRNVHTICQRDGIFLHPVTILGHRHDLWRIARTYAHANY